MLNRGLYYTMTVKFLTKFEKYLFWDAFFVSLPDMTHYVSSHKVRTEFTPAYRIMYIGQWKGHAIPGQRLP